METPSHRKRLPVVGDLNEAMRHLTTCDPGEDAAAGQAFGGEADPADLGLTSTRKRLEGLLHDVTDAGPDPRAGSRKRLDLSPGIWVPSTKKPAHMRQASGKSLPRSEFLTPESVLGGSKLFGAADITPEPMGEGDAPGRRWQGGGGQGGCS